jgi:hypothetical protein
VPKYPLWMSEALRGTSSSKRGANGGVLFRLVKSDQRISRSSLREIERTSTSKGERLVRDGGPYIYRRGLASPNKFVRTNKPGLRNYYGDIRISPAMEELGPLTEKVAIEKIVRDVKDARWEVNKPMGSERRAIEESKAFGREIQETPSVGSKGRRFYKPEKAEVFRALGMDDTIDMNDQRFPHMVSNAKRVGEQRFVEINEKLRNVQRQIEKTPANRRKGLKDLQKQLYVEVKDLADELSRLPGGAELVDAAIEKNPHVKYRLRQQLETFGWMSRNSVQNLEMYSPPEVKARQQALIYQKKAEKLFDVNPAAALQASKLSGMYARQHQDLAEGKKGLDPSAFKIVKERYTNLEKGGDAFDFEKIKGSKDWKPDSKKNLWVQEEGGGRYLPGRGDSVARPPEDPVGAMKGPERVGRLREARRSWGNMSSVRKSSGVPSVMAGGSWSGSSPQYHLPYRQAPKMAPNEGVSMSLGMQSRMDRLMEIRQAAAGGSVGAKGQPLLEGMRIPLRQLKGARMGGPKGAVLKALSKLI